MENKDSDQKKLHGGHFFLQRNEDLSPLKGR